MILSDIKDYLMQRQRTSLADLALHLEAEPDAVRGMLERWVNKGKVRRLLASDLCGSSCTRCDPAATEIYEWITPGTPVTREYRAPFPTRCKP